MCLLGIRYGCWPFLSYLLAGLWHEFNSCGRSICHEQGACKTDLSQSCFVNKPFFFWGLVKGASPQVSNPLQKTGSGIVIKLPRWTCKLHTDCPSLRKIWFPIAPLKLPTLLSLSIPTMCCSGSCCDHHLWHQYMKLLGFLVNWNTPTMIVNIDCAILSWYTDTFMTPEPYDVQDLGLLLYYTRKTWGHRYFLPRQALTRRLDFGTLSPGK